MLVSPVRLLHRGPLSPAWAVSASQKRSAKLPEKVSSRATINLLYNHTFCCGEKQVLAAQISATCRPSRFDARCTFFSARATVAGSHKKRS